MNKNRQVIVNLATGVVAHNPSKEFVSSVDDFMSLVLQLENYLEVSGTASPSLVDITDYFSGRSDGEYDG